MSHPSASTVVNALGAYQMEWLNKYRSIQLDDVWRRLREVSDEYLYVGYSDDSRIDMVCNLRADPYFYWPQDDKPCESECFRCGDECNPGSQMCGSCSRLSVFLR